MLTQLNPPIPVETPKGEGQAVVLIDYGPDYDLLWVVFDNATGECWTWKNDRIRGVRNLTMNHRPNGSPGGLGLPAASNGNGAKASAKTAHDANLAEDPFEITRPILPRRNP